MLFVILAALRWGDILATALFVVIAGLVLYAFVQDAITKKAIRKTTGSILQSLVSMGEFEPVSDLEHLRKNVLGWLNLEKIHTAVIRKSEKYTSYLTDVTAVVEDEETLSRHDLTLITIPLDLIFVGELVLSGPHRRDMCFVFFRTFEEVMSRTPEPQAGYMIYPLEVSHARSEVLLHKSGLLAVLEKVRQAGNAPEGIYVTHKGVVTLWPRFQEMDAVWQALIICEEIASCMDKVGHSSDEA